MIANHSIYGVISYHVTLSEGHMIADWLSGDPLRESHDSQSPHICTMQLTMSQGF